MDKVFRENKELVPKAPSAPGLRPITHKEFNKFIKGKGFTGRNNYKLKDLTLFSMGGPLWPPYSFSLISPE